MAIFDEQVLEPFVAKGIGNSGVASRQIQATNLPDLSAAVRQSQMTQQNLEEQQNSTLKALAIKNMKRPSIAKAVDTNGEMKPFVVGVSKANAGMPSYHTVAIPDGNGSYTLKSIATGGAGLSGGANDADIKRGIENLKQMGIDMNQKYPEFSLSGAGGKYSSSDLKALLAEYSSQAPNSAINLRDIIAKIGMGGSTTRTNAGWKNFSLSPNPEEKRNASAKKTQALEDKKMSLRNLAAGLENSDIRAEAQRKLGLKF